MRPIDYLKPWDIVKFHSGDLYFYVPDYFGMESFVGKTGYLLLDSYKSDLKVKNAESFPEFTIDCIYRTKTYDFGFRMLDRVHEEYKLVWKRESTVELTMEDIAKKYGVDKIIITNYKN